jgi:hypothetical protein
MLYEDWSRVVEERFPPREPIAVRNEWNALKQRLTSGQSVSGTVLAKAAFGAWLDIGVGFPALLLVPDAAGLTPEAYAADDWCPVGSALTVEVVLFNDDSFVVRVAQGTPHENRARTNGGASNGSGARHE